MNLFCLILFFFALPFLSLSQESKNIKHQNCEELINSYNNILGLNDEIINGTLYLLPNKNIQGSPFLLENDWDYGDVFIKGEKYENVLINYDLTMDELLMKYQTPDGLMNILSLNKSQVDSFYLSQKTFVKLISPSESNLTFYEKISDVADMLVIKHKKKFLNIYNSITPYGKFSTESEVLYLFKSGILHKIDTKKRFLALFEKELQEKINKYLKNNDISFKTINRDKLKGLMNYISQP